MIGSNDACRASIRLWGHRSVPAHLSVERYPRCAWLGRIALFVLAWMVGTSGTLIVTFDPFIASFPFVLGLGMIHHAIRGRYRVNSFRGACPRCATELVVKPGSKIRLPYSLTCFHCHFEPALVLAEPNPQP